MGGQLEIVVKVASRASPLARAQVEEVYRELCHFHPNLHFEHTSVVARGDRDLSASLRDLEKSDFFTREIDALVSQKICDVAIHSAKDLPEPLPRGLNLVAMTKGVDPADMLILGKPSPRRVGSSSVRRDIAVKELFPDAVCLDIRGTIERRLALLDSGEYDAVVMAEAALIRLGLTWRRRIRLPCAPALHQGRLAVVAREGDLAMRQLFAALQAAH